MHRYSRVKTELGDFWVACSPCGITAIRPATEIRSAFENAYKKRFGICPLDGDIPDSYKQALRRTLEGSAVPSVAIDWTCFTGFQRKVLKRLQKIPAGKTQTYSWLARRSGNPKAARAVGNVMARNPIPFLIPCHRIVPASGGIGNYGLGKKLKRELLLREGIDIE
jgi:O-6-methylguanine DNA methyltransferase